MKKIVNVSPVGDLEIPEFGLVIKAGETVDVSEAVATKLLAQPINFVEAKPAPKKGTDK